MKYAGIILNDFSAAPGVCVTFFLQGCDRHCQGCHNPETWDFNGGKEFTQETLDRIISAISANDIKRNFCIMGGEPLHPNNIFLTNLVIQEVKKHYPNIKIYLWTGYTYDELKYSTDKILNNILKNINFLIDGPYIESQRDITLFMRGSKNQNIICLRE